jgi:thioredoxin-like negative regulator of GroEL
MEVISEERDDIEVFYIDVDENQELAMDSSVTGVPTLRFYVDDNEVGSSTGAKPRREIDNMLSEYFG